MYEHLYKKVNKRLKASESLIDMLTDCGWYKIGMNIPPSAIDKYTMFINNPQAYAFFAYVDDETTMSYGFCSANNEGYIIDSMIIGTLNS